MTAALLLASLVAGLLFLLVTFVQLLYLESLRLRPRELPSLEFFKETLEARLAFETERGALIFSLVKHTLLVLMGVFALAGTRTMAEAILAAWAAMLLFGYILPQALYRRTSARWLLPLTPLIRALAFPFYPLVATLTFFHSVIHLADEENGHEAEPTPAENVDALIDAGTEEGLIEEDDRKLIQSVVEFGDKRVREVMTPRPRIVAIPASRSLDDLRQLVIHEQYSRIPVYEDSIDQVSGFVHVRDVFELDDDQRAGRSIGSLMRPIRPVPETKPVDDLLREMQSDGTHMVVVVDEYGNTAGIATMEDLVEVIVGEIRDEHEPDRDFTEEGAGTYVVSGSFELDRLDDMLGLAARGDTESTTVGGLISEWLGRVPASGDVVEREGLHVEVLSSSDLRVEKVRIRRSQETTR